MALRTPPSWMQNGSHPAENDRLTTQAIWKTTGVINSGDLAVSANATPNMSINVASGWAAIVGNYQANMGTYMVFNDATTNLAITAANGSNPRIDLLVITISDAYYTGTLNQVTFTVIAGTPSGSPTVPSTPTNSLALAQIYVGASVTSITNANITNYNTQATTSIGISSTSTVSAVDFVTSTSNGTGVGSLNNDIMELIMGAL